MEPKLHRASEDLQSTTSLQVASAWVRHLQASESEDSSQQEVGTQEKNPKDSGRYFRERNKILI